MSRPLPALIQDSLHGTVEVGSITRIGPRGVGSRWAFIIFNARALPLPTPVLAFVLMSRPHPRFIMAFVHNAHVVQERVWRADDVRGKWAPVEENPNLYNQPSEQTELPDGSNRIDCGTNGFDSGRSCHSEPAAASPFHLPAPDSCSGGAQTTEGFGICTVTAAWC